MKIKIDTSIDLTVIKWRFDIEGNRMWLVFGKMIKARQIFDQKETGKK